MRSFASSDFFRVLYAHLGGLITTGILRSLAWLPLILWMSRATPKGSIGGSYGLGALGFLVLALFADPFLAGAAMGLSARIVEGRPASVRDALAGLGLRYRAMIAWTWLQTAIALIGLYNFMQMLSPASSVPSFLAVLSTTLSFWVWIVLRAMNIHLPSMLVRERLPLREALPQALMTVAGRPWLNLGLLVFRFGLTVMLVLSGVGLLLGMGSFGVLHGFSSQKPPVE